MSICAGGCAVVRAGGVHAGGLDASERADGWASARPAKGEGEAEGEAVGERTRG